MSKIFDLYIKKSVYAEEHFHSFSLDDIGVITHDEFHQVFKQSKTEPVYKIKCGDMYYVGRKKDNASGEYFPVFSQHHPKVYYTSAKALEESYHLRQLGYNTEYV